MNKAKLEQFFDLLGDIVNEDGPYREKRKALVEAASEEDRTTLNEFISWFDEVDSTEDT